VISRIALRQVICSLRPAPFRTGDSSRRSRAQVPGSLRWWIVISPGGTAVDSQGHQPLGKQGQIDKAFCIGTPMRKAYWTRRFVARLGGVASHPSVGEGGDLSIASRTPLPSRHCWKLPVEGWVRRARVHVALEHGCLELLSLWSMSGWSSFSASLLRMMRFLPPITARRVTSDG
jgi:hypothetical protein